MFRNWSSGVSLFLPVINWPMRKHFGLYLKCEFFVSLCGSHHSWTKSVKQPQLLQYFCTFYSTNYSKRSNTNLVVVVCGTVQWKWNLNTSHTAVGETLFSHNHVVKSRQTLLSSCRGVQMNPPWSVPYVTSPNVSQPWCSRVATELQLDMVQIIYSVQYNRLSCLIELKPISCIPQTF